MKKKYVFWWALAAILFYWSITNAYYYGIRYLGTMFWVIVCIYVGYRRWVEYHENQDDRRMVREYLAAKTAEANKNIKDKESDGSAEDA